MNKIGLRIEMVSDGAAVLFTSCEGDWLKRVADMRDILKFYAEEPVDDIRKFIMFMSFGEDGSYLTLMLPKNGRGGDNISAWIYIPNCIEVEGEEVVSILKDVKEELLKKTRDDSKLSMLFSNEYPSVDSAPFMPSSKEWNFALRKTGVLTLADLLGDRRYQTYYSKYRAVIIEDDDTLPVTESMVDDISDKPLERTLLFHPPHVEGDVVTFIEHGGEKRFAEPVRVVENETVTVIFRRKGFADIRNDQTVVTDNQVCIVPKPLIWKVRIGIDRFRICSAADAGKDLTGSADIEINGKHLTPGSFVDLKESEAKDVLLRVEVPGYKSIESRVDFLKNSTLPIQLQRAEREQVWNIELANGGNATMTLRSKGLSEDYSESPLKGYSVEGARTLTFSGVGVLRERLIGFGIAFGIAIAVILGFMLYRIIGQVGEHIEEKTENVPTDSVHEPDQEETINAAEIPEIDPAAIAYLDEHTFWSKKDLERYPDLIGLFDDMNEYQFYELEKKWGKDLINSNEFGKIYSKICEISNLGDASVINQHFENRTYNKQGDYMITISAYINRLDTEMKAINKKLPKPKEIDADKSIIRKDSTNLIPEINDDSSEKKPIQGQKDKRKPQVQTT